MTDTSKRIPVQQITYRDKNNVLTRGSFLIVNGQRVSPKIILGSVWKQQQFKGQGKPFTALSRFETVFQFKGQPFRMGSKYAIPLELQKSEEFHPVEFAGKNESFKASTIIYI